LKIEERVYWGLKRGEEGGNIQQYQAFQLNRSGSKDWNLCEMLVGCIGRGIFTVFTV